MFFLMAWSVAAMIEIPVCRIRLPAGFLSKLIQQAYWVDVVACLEFQIRKCQIFCVRAGNGLPSGRP
ncbi:hypothetical protein CC207_23365 [Pseudomonas sp. DrBHI1]|nr:hypothetical protein CC207_23365 [Pseudomonas sp. DrBHI1]